MRWKLLRRRLSVSAPRVIVRSHLPWPVRWAAVALVLGFSAALAMWAFELGRDWAGLDRHAKAELAKLQLEVAQLQSERQKSLSIANTAESLLRSERTLQERLTQQLKQVEAENLELKADLGFFERLLPTDGTEGVSIRGLQAERREAGRLRVQLLVMQAGKTWHEFNGRYEVTLTGSMDGKAWSFSPVEGPQPLKMKQYLRLEALVEYPATGVVKTVQVKVLDPDGRVKAWQSADI